MGDLRIKRFTTVEYKVRSLVLRFWVRISRRSWAASEPRRGTSRRHKEKGRAVSGRGSFTAACSGPSEQWAMSRPGRERPEPFLRVPCGAEACRPAAALSLDGGRGLLSGRSGRPGVLLTDRQWLPNAGTPPSPAGFFVSQLGPTLPGAAPYESQGRIIRGRTLVGARPTPSVGIIRSTRLYFRIRRKGDRYRTLPDHTSFRL